MSRQDRFAVVALVLLPLLWLWPCTFGDRYFVSYDVNQFPPVSTTASEAELQQARAGANYDVTEVPVWFLPELEYAHDELAAGRLPTWNPRARAGAPLHAHGLIGLCYPPNWIALFAEEPAARLGLVAWINLALGGLLAFGLLRQLGAGAAAAFVGAALFELSGPMATNALFWMRLASFVWLPGVLWAMARIAAADRLRPLQVAALALAFAMTGFGGFPPFAATTTVFAGLWFLWLVGMRCRDADRRQAARLAGTLLLGLGLGALLTLPQVLPSLLFFPESARPPTPLWTDISGQAFEPYGLLTWFMPEAFGHPTAAGAERVGYANGAAQLLWNTRTNADGGAALPNYNYTEYALTVSSLGIVLALLGAVLGRGRHAGFARVGLAVALGLGLFLPGLQLLFHLPLVQNVWPMRWPAAGTLFVAWLAALGFDRVRAHAPRAAVVAGVVAILAAGLMWWCATLPASWHAADGDWLIETLMERFGSDRAGVVNHLQAGAPAGVDRVAQGFARLAAAGAAGAAWLGGAGAVRLAAGLLRGRARDAALWAAVAAAVLQLGLHGASSNRGAHAARTRETEVHTFLRERAAALAEEGGVTVVRATAVPTGPWPGQLPIDGLRDRNYYSHADARTLQPLRRLFDRYHTELGLGPDAGALAAAKGYLTQTLPAALLRHPWFDLVGLRYVLTNEAGLQAPPYLLGEVVGPQLRGRGAFFVHERPNALPRAFVAPRIVPLADDDAVLDALTQQDLDPSAQAFVVRDELPEPAPDATESEPRAVTFVTDRANEIVLDVGPGDAQALVLTDAFLSGWTATVDGAPAPVTRCNHSQRLVVVPRRACRVRFAYAAPGLAAGAGLAAFAVLAALAWWGLWRRGSR